MNRCCCKCTPRVVDISPEVEVPELPPIIIPEPEPPKPEPPKPEPEPPKPEPPPAPINAGTYIWLDYFIGDTLSIDGVLGDNLDPIYDLGVVEVAYDKSEAIELQSGVFSMVFSRENTQDKVVTLKLDPTHTSGLTLATDVKVGERPLTLQDLHNGITITFANKPNDEYYTKDIYKRTQDFDFETFYKYDVQHLDKSEYIEFIALDKSWLVNGVVATELALDGVDKIITSTKVWLIPKEHIIGSRHIEISSTSPIVFKDTEISSDNLTYGTTAHFRLSNPSNYTLTDKVKDT